MAKESAKSKTLSTAVALAMAASLSVPFTAYADEDANASQEATQQEETTAANGGSVTSNEETATVKATGETEADAKGAIALHSNESAQAVAEVDGMKYASIAAAIAAIDAKGTVTLLGDVTEDVTIPEGKAITLDLNGKKLTNKASHTITNNGTLTVTDSIGGGVVDNITHAKAALSNAVDATATLEGGTFMRSKEAGKDGNNSGGNSYYTIENYGSMSFGSGASVENAGHFSSMIRNGGKNTAESPAEMTINGGTFSGGINTIKNDDYGNLTINDGDFDNTSQYVIMNWSKATINNGTFKTSSKATSAVLFNSSYGNDPADIGSLEVNGGTFTTNSAAQPVLTNYYDANNTATSTVINNGIFNGDLVNESEHKGPLSVSGGTFTDPAVAKHLKSGKAVLFNDGKYAVGNEDAVKGDATYSVTNTDGTVVYFTDAQAANDYAKESGAQAPVVLKVTVNFDSNQGTAVDSQLVAVGDKVAKPADPTKKGYTFSGWFTDEGCTNAYDFDAPVNGTQPEFTLYAGWKAVPATVEPDNGNNGNNGGNGDSSSANANVNVNTVNNNGDNASSEAKMATVKTGDNLALVGGAIAVIAVAAAGVAAFALRRRKMN
ncbi:MAG: InlB B-repeat-containing protein [Eggerthellaceae bacterium]